MTTRFKNFALAIALTISVGLIAGCQTFKSDTSKIGAACASATSSIQIATIFKDKLSELQVTRVKQAIAVTQPICGDRDTVPTLDSVKQAALDAAVHQLFQIATEVQK